MYVKGVEGVKYTSTIQRNVSNVTYVKDVKDGVCSFYATWHTEVENPLYTVAAHPSKREGNTNFDLISALKCLKNVGLWSSFGIGRYRFFHSSLLQANRCDNLVHLGLNAWKPTAQNLPESNCSNWALI